MGKVFAICDLRGKPTSGPGMVQKNLNSTSIDFEETTLSILIIH